MSRTMTRTVDLEPIDRLEEKVRQLVGMIERLRGDQARLTQENQRLMGEIDTLQSRLEAAEGVTGELTTLRDEREVIRGRVAEMLEQLEALSL
jgi:FtsZ-binding cell division protein ZapB